MGTDLQNLFEKHNALLQISSPSGHVILLAFDGGMYNMQVQHKGQVISLVPLGYEYDIAIKTFHQEVGKYL